MISDNNGESNNIISVLLIGENFSGKTAIIQRIKEDRFYEEDEYYYNGARIKYEIVFDYK